MKSLQTLFIPSGWLAATVFVLFVNGCSSKINDEPAPVAEAEPSYPPVLLGEWCRENKRRVTQYTVKQGSLKIRSARSGQIFEVALDCDQAFTTCEAQTVRGWGTPVTEILRLDGENMQLTRVWGGAWKDKTYQFTYQRCPKW